jgi:erythromycin esterase-like protein
MPRVEPLIAATLLVGCAHSSGVPAQRGEDAVEIERTAAEILERVGDAHVIGLGEACHGEAITREVQLAVLRRAVVDRGCRSVVIEGRFTDEASWNDWVHERGRRAHERLSAFAGRMPRQWADTYQWLRDEGGEVEVVGTDPCVSRRACLSTIIQRLAPYSAKGADALRSWQALDESEIAARFAGWKPPDGVPPHERATLERIAELVRESSLDESIRGGVPDARERIMADNVMWARARTNTCVVVLAHDGHTDTTHGTNPEYPWWIPIRPMGGYLRERLGEDYAAVHFALGHGTVTAYRIVGGVLRTSHLRRAIPQRVFELSTPIEGSLEHRLRHQRALTVVRTADVADEPLFVRELPFAWSRLAARKGVDWILKPPSAFDVVVYVPRAVPMVAGDGT